MLQSRHICRVTGGRRAGHTVVTPHAGSYAIAHLHTEPNKNVGTSSSKPAESHALSSLAHDIGMYKSVSGDLIRQKWDQAYSFYEQFSHMDEVREAQDKVIYIQNELQQAQQKRSDLQHELNIVRKEMSLLLGEMSNCAPNDYRRVELTRLNIEANQREREKLDAFQNEDQRERNLFTHLTAAVKASHEKEKIYANTVKYWSILLSLLGAAVGVAGSALSYHYRQNTYRTLTDKYTAQVVLIESHIGGLHTELDALRHEIKAARIVQQRTLEVAVRKGAMQKVGQQDGGGAAESWSGFLYRKSVDCYRWFVPRQTQAK